MDFKALAEDEWKQFKSSKTVKVALGIVATSLTALIIEAVQGKIRSLADLKFYAALEAGTVIALCLRHTFAGIESKLAILGPDNIERIKKAAQDEVLEHVAQHSATAAEAARKTLASSSL